MSPTLSEIADRSVAYRQAWNEAHGFRNPCGKQLSASSPTPSEGMQPPVSMPRGTMGTTKRRPPHGCRRSWTDHVLRPPVLLLASVSTILILMVALAVLLSAR